MSVIMIDGASTNACKLQQEGFLLDLRKNLAKILGIQVADPASWWANGLLKSPLRPTHLHYPRRLLHRKRKFNTISLGEVKILSYRW